MKRLHTFDAYRVLHRPSSQDDYRPHVRDLVEDVTSGTIEANGIDADGTPLMALALHGWEPGRLERGATLQIPFPRALGASAFVYPPEQAAGWWQLPAFAFLFAGANPFEAWPSSPSSSRQTWSCPALKAIGVGAVDVLKACLTHPDRAPAKAFDALRIGDHHQTLLQWLLIRPFSRPTLDVLLDYGLNPNEPNAEGRTPLFFAENAETVRVLLEAGASPFHQAHDGSRAPDCWSSSLRNPTEVLDAFAQHTQPGADPQPIGSTVVQAARGGSWKTMLAAMKATAWDPLSAVNPHRSERRLLPEVALLLARNLSSGPVLYRPLNESEPHSPP